MNDSAPVRDERDVWKILYSPTKESSGLRKWYHDKFEALFPEGHRTSLRETVAYGAQLREAGETFEETQAHLLGHVHPKALQLIAERGLDYWPIGWKKARPDLWEAQPVNGSCSADADLMMEMSNRFKNPGRTNIVYVEGIAFGPDVPVMLHAWNARGVWSRKALDWNHYATSVWSRYIGVPFTSEETERLRRLINQHPRSKPMLFANEHWPFIEDDVRRILEGRNM